MGVRPTGAPPADPCHPCNTSTQVYRNSDVKCDCTGLPVKKHCKDHYDTGVRHNGLYVVSPDGGSSVVVFCDQTDDGGGWTVIQNRFDGSTRFYNRGWTDFKKGKSELFRE